MIDSTKLLAENPTWQVPQLATESSTFRAGAPAKSLVAFLFSNPARSLRHIRGVLSVQYCTLWWKFAFKPGSAPPADDISDALPPLTFLPRERFNIKISAPHWHRKSSLSETGGRRTLGPDRRPLPCAFALPFYYAFTAPWLRESKSGRMRRLVWALGS